MLQNVNSIQEITNENAELLQRIALHPSTNYPGRTQEHILLTLLRKKLEPDIESWVEEARETARAAGLDPSKLVPGGKLGGGYGDDDSDNDAYGLDDQEGEIPPDPFNEQWADIRDACFEGIKDYIENQAPEPYTIAEQQMGIKNVRTGLKRSLEEESEEDEDEEDEEDDEDMGGVLKDGTAVPVMGQGAPGSAGGVPSKVPGLQPEHLFWFAARGDLNLPPYVELASQRKVREAGKKPGVAR